MKKVGLLLFDEAESLFAKREFEYIQKNLSFEEMTSKQECEKALFDGRIDAYISSCNNLTNSNPSPQTDWFLFSWYEDYPYNTIFFGKKGSKVITPSSAIKEGLDLRIFSKEIRFLNLKPHDKLKKVISQVTSGQLFALMVPGRLANYIKEEYKEVLTGINEKEINLTNRKMEKEFCFFYRQNDKSISNILPYFIKSVAFVGAGAGDSTLCSIAGIDAIKHAQVCLYDSLLDHNLLSYLPKNSIAINVGKRHHHHSVEQPKINEMIEQYARSGFRVVRLKSGDPSIFGRLAEEIAYLEYAGIPYRVIPGISSLSSMAANTGMVLTRRGINRGFCVMSPIKHGGGFARVDIEERKKLPMIFFMGIRVVDKIANNLIDEGYSRQTKAAVAFSIGGEDEFVIKGTLSTIADKIKPLTTKDTIPPGLFIVGDISGFSFKKLSIFQKNRILVAGFGEKVEEISTRFKDFGAKCVIFSPKCIDEDEFYATLQNVDKFKVLAFSEGNIFESFIKSFIKYKQNLFKLPSIVVASKEVEEVVKKFGLSALCLKQSKKNKVLYIYSNKSKTFYTQLKSDFALVEESRCKKTITRGEIKSFNTAVFLDSESFWEFVNANKDEFLKKSFIWIKKDDEILSFLSKRSANFNILPENLGNQSTDIRFMFFNLIESKKRSVAI